MKKLLLLTAFAAVFSLAAADLAELFKYTPKAADSVLVVKADRLPAAVTESEDAKKAAAELGFDLKDITGLVVPFHAGDDEMIVGGLVGVKGNLQVSQLLDKAEVEHEKLQIEGHGAVKVTHDGNELYIVDYAPGVLLLVNDEAAAKPFFATPDAARGKELAKLCPDAKALLWAVVNVPAPAADDKEAQESDPGIRRVTAFCRLTENGDKIDTFFKTILACKNADSANGCSAMMQMLVMPIVTGAFAEDEALSKAVNAAIKPQVAGNNFEVSVTIPHDLAVKLGEFAKAAAKEQLAGDEEGAAKDGAQGGAKSSAPAGGK